MTTVKRTLGALAALALVGAIEVAGQGVEVERVSANPIVRPQMEASIGTNINGPSMIRVPDWVEDRLGDYYLYFAHHKGAFIRLAWASHPEGPWTVHAPGSLRLEESLFLAEVPDPATLSEEARRRYEAAVARNPENAIPHIASPDAVVDEERREIRLYYHGILPNGRQATRVAVSRDGLRFEAREEVLTQPYLRVFRWQGHVYGLAKPGVLYRSADGLGDFEVGPTLFDPRLRHAGVVVRGHTLFVFFSRSGDAPEHILLSTVDLRADWSEWTSSPPMSVLRPEHPWEGAELPIEPSLTGHVTGPAHQLRDPAIFEDKERLWLLYSVAGEQGIGMARLRLTIDE